MNTRIAAAAVAAFLLAGILPPTASAAAAAEQADLPAAGEVILRVTGARVDGGKGVNFTFQDLQKLVNVKIRSTTQYVGSAEFEGPRLRDILRAARVPVGAREVILVGADGYRARAPVADFEKYEVVAAHTVNGKRLTLDSKGPLWVMYPNEKHQELIGHATNDKLVWSFVQVQVP